MRCFQIILDEFPGLLGIFPRNQSNFLADQFIIHLLIQNLLPQLLAVEVRLLGSLQCNLQVTQAALSEGLDLVTARIFSNSSSRLMERGSEDFVFQPLFPSFSLQANGVKENGKFLVKLPLECGPEKMDDLFCCSGERRSALVRRRTILVYASANPE